MAEIATAFGLLACTGSFIAVGVAFGTRYIDRTLNVDAATMQGTPLVRRTRPSGENWQATKA